MMTQRRNKSKGCTKTILLAAAIIGIVLPVLAFFGIKEFTDLVHLEDSAKHREPTPEMSPTPVGVRNPTGMVPAGTPILASNLQLVVSEHLALDKYGPENNIGFEISVENVGSDSETIQYTVSAFKLRDDLGNIIPLV